MSVGCIECDRWDFPDNTELAEAAGWTELDEQPKRLKRLVTRNGRKTWLTHDQEDGTPEYYGLCPECREERMPLYE